MPAPGPGEMLVRVDACGICPTDLKKIEKGLLPGPRIFGHEIAGTVAALGRGTRAFREGDRVVVHHHVPCGELLLLRTPAPRPVRALQAEPHHGGLRARRAAATPSTCWRASPWWRAASIPIPKGVLAEEAAFVEPVNTCLKAVRKARGRDRARRCWWSARARSACC